MNLYAYVGNDPVNLTDPTGMAPGCVTERDNMGIDVQRCEPSILSIEVAVFNAGTPSRIPEFISRPPPQSPQTGNCNAPMTTYVGSARAVLEAGAMGADVATVGFAATGIGGPIAAGTKIFGYGVEFALFGVNAFDGLANGNYGSLQSQGASLGTRLVPGGRTFQKGLKAARGPTGALRDRAGRFRSSHLNNPGIEQAAQTATERGVGNLAEAVVCPR